MVQFLVIPLHLEPSPQARPKPSPTLAFIPTFSSLNQQLQSMGMLSPLSQILPTIPSFAFATMQVPISPGFSQHSIVMADIPPPARNSFLPLPSAPSPSGMENSLSAIPMF